MEVTEVQVIIAWLAIRDIFILEVGVPKVTVIQILVIAVCLHFICSAVCLHFCLHFLPGMRMATGSHMMSYTANPHSYQTSHVSNA